MFSYLPTEQRAIPFTERSVSRRPNLVVFENNVERSCHEDCPGVGT